MTYIKINGTLYPASISGRLRDLDWDGRESKTIKLAMTSAMATSLFADDTAWSIVIEDVDDDDHTVQEEYDNSDYCMAGDITDHRDGYVSVKMGKPTDAELFAIITGGAI